MRKTSLIAMICLLALTGAARADEFCGDVSLLELALRLGATCRQDTVCQAQPCCCGMTSAPNPAETPSAPFRSQSALFQLPSPRPEPAPSLACPEPVPPAPQSLGRPPPPKPPPR